MSSETAHTGDEKVAEAITKAAQDKTPDQTVQYKHKYKWRAEETTIVSVLYAMTLGLAVWGITHEMNIGMFIASGIVLVVAAAVTNLGESRKRKSRLTAIHNKTTGDFSVEGNGYKASDNTIKIQDVTRVYMKKKATREDDIDPRDLLIISRDNGKGVEIPMRLVSRAGLMEFLKELTAKINKTEDKKVTELFEAAEDYKG